MRGWARIAGLMLLMVAVSPGIRAELAHQTHPHRRHLRAGGAADIWARIIAEPLSKALNQSVVIENRGGGGGIVASTQVARAEPDGYTILMGGLAPQILAPAIAGNAGFDALRDFTHIAYVGGRRSCSWCRRRASCVRSATSSPPRRPTNSPAMPRRASARSAISSWNMWRSA